MHLPASIVATSPRLETARKISAMEAIQKSKSKAVFLSLFDLYDGFVFPFFFGSLDLECRVLDSSAVSFSYLAGGFQAFFFLLFGGRGLCDWMEWV